jgi:hypothetical protein
MSDLIDKIGSLLMKAESTDNQHEKDAYLSKAQSLATLASIDLEVARGRQITKTERETPIKRQIQLFDYNDKSRNKSAFVYLFLGIGEVNDLMFDIAHNSTYVIAYGYPSDIDVTEALYATLSQQMVREAEDYLKTGDYKTEIVRTQVKRKNPIWGDYDYETVTKPLDGRVARRSFYDGFKSKVVSRMKEARKAVIEDYHYPIPAGAEVFVNGEKIGVTAPTVSADLVLKDKRETVGAFRKATSNARGSYKGSYGGNSNSGYSAGQKAGSRASLGGGGSIGGKKAIA